MVSHVTCHFFLLLFSGQCGCASWEGFVISRATLFFLKSFILSFMVKTLFCLSWDMRNILVSYLLLILLLTHSLRKFNSFFYTQLRILVWLTFDVCSLTNFCAHVAKSVNSPHFLLLCSLPSPSVENKHGQYGEKSIRTMYKGLDNLVPQIHIYIRIEWNGIQYETK